ncbi:hypothetical protein [Nocardioides donggukensis]|uniref:Uncharacterized protein n=1 Tax=Nocardioides donggukensis TaxID=2774019 RepID=A0A927KA86_9ACTN|nr:hypothetical protein [Nocardioides donggukensis]MBD8870505.1 hypothetical protein [Nocardioides donggukensis]
MIPKGWSSLTTDERSRGAQIKRLLDRRLAGVSRDAVATARHQIAQALEEQLAKAAEQGAQQLHVQTEPMRGVPISASLVVTVVDNIQDSSFPAAIERALGSSEGVLDHGPSQAGPYASLRRVRRVQSQDAGTDGQRRWETCVDHVIEVSDTDLLVLTFATTTDQVSGPLVLLFDAIADSLQPAPEESGGCPDSPAAPRVT